MTNSFSYPVDAVFLIGPTGSGKSPLGELMVSRGFLNRRCHHLDFGSELRSIVSGIGAASFTKQERHFLLGVLEHGLLLENEWFFLAEKILGLFLIRSRFQSGNVLVLNGIPRHIGQAQDISTIVRVHSLVVLVCSVESVFRRIEENVAGDRTGRIDDERMLVEKKLRIYSERTAPLIDHYRTSGCTIYHLLVKEHSMAVSAFDLLSSLAAADPPVTLVAEPPQ